jgi:type IV secretory pathway VirB2 component (pilin)
MKRSSLLILATGVIIGLSLGLMLTPFIATEEHVTIAPWLEVVHRVCTSVGGLGTFVALIFVVRQFNLLHTQSQ